MSVFPTPKDMAKFYFQGAVNVILLQNKIIADVIKGPDMWSLWWEELNKHFRLSLEIQKHHDLRGKATSKFDNTEAQFCQVAQKA
jgi:hypothetical protein